MIVKFEDQKFSIAYLKNLVELGKGAEVILKYIEQLKLEGKINDSGTVIDLSHFRNKLNS